MDSDRLEFVLLKEIYDVLDTLGFNTEMMTEMFSVKLSRLLRYLTDSRIEYEWVRLHIESLDQLRRSDSIDLY